MTMSFPFVGFHPKKLGRPAHGNVPSGDFVEWAPLKDYLKEEQEGFLEWQGAELEAIAIKEQLPVPPLASIFGDLFERLWVRAVPTKTLPQKNILAQTRVQAPGAAPVAAYRPMVAATVTAGINALNKDAKKHLIGVASDWAFHTQLKRMSAYTFRGDGRDPNMLKSAGGFHPPSTRTDDAYIKDAIYKQFCSYLLRRFDRDLAKTTTPDQFLAMVRAATPTPDARETFLFYTTWRSLAKSEELHLGRMLAEESLKGYISTTRATPVAKAFACKRETRRGWVYVTRVVGGFVVPEKKQSQWTKIFGEQELAVAGSITWADVVGARETQNGKFAGNIFLKPEIEKTPYFERIFKLLSGKRQS
jgi:hypothetical protein